MHSLPLLQELRAIKTKKELALIISAQRISEKVLEEVVGGLKKGVTEIKVAEDVISHFKKSGVKALPFPPIVAFGKGTVDIHHLPGKNRLKIGDTIVIDLGATVGGYCSDMTRTYFFNEASKEQKVMYNHVLKAQEKVLELIVKGERRASKLDWAARNYLDKRYGTKAFAHTLGHGVGTVIHEWPILRASSEDVLKSGMVITIEPGIYIKGKGGIRIEDLILITKSGYKILSKAKKNFQEIII